MELDFKKNSPLENFTGRLQIFLTKGTVPLKKKRKINFKIYIYIYSNIIM